MPNTYADNRATNYTEEKYPPRRADLDDVATFSFKTTPEELLAYDWTPDARGVKEYIIIEHPDTDMKAVIALKDWKAVLRTYAKGESMTCTIHSGQGVTVGYDYGTHRSSCSLFTPVALRGEIKKPEALLWTDHIDTKLVKCLKWVDKGSESTQNRPALSHILIHDNKAITADGYRLFMAQLTDEEVSSLADYMTPFNLSYVELTNEGVQRHIIEASCLPNQVRIRKENGKRETGMFPDYQAILDPAYKSNTLTLTFIASELQSVLKSLKDMASDNAHSVRMTSDNSKTGYVMLRTTSAERGDKEAYLEAVTDHTIGLNGARNFDPPRFELAPFDIAFNVKYMIDAIAQADTRNRPKSRKAQQGWSPGLVHIRLHADNPNENPYLVSYQDKDNPHRKLEALLMPMSVHR